MSRVLPGLVALVLIASATGLAEARRVRLKSTRDAQATLARWQARAARPGQSARCAACNRFGLGIARALVKQRALGGAGKGIFSGTDPATGARKVVHLELVAEKAGVMTLRVETVDGDQDGASVTREFREQTAGRGDYRSTDGQARFRLIRGRGIFDYHDTTFAGDPQ